MFFPYSTDAPIYYRPFVIVSMIAINVLVFLFEIANPEQIAPLMLEVGNGLHPVQWLTNNFLHAGIMHLVLNMISLWAFGLVVEGKLGPWKTLLVYLGIGVLYGATVQILMLSSEHTFCLGASAIIFGLMAMSLIWAPENTMDCLLIVWFRPFLIEAQVKMIVGVFLVLQFLVLFLNGMALSSEFLHVIGAIMGTIVGIVLLKMDWVDCEHWDIFSVWAGLHLMSEAERKHAESQTPKALKEQEERNRIREARIRQRKEMLHEEIVRAIHLKEPLPAFVIAQKTMQEYPEWCLPKEDFLLLIQQLIDKRLWQESVDAMQLYLIHYSQNETPVQLKLARTLLEIKQPISSLKVLKKIDVASLNPSQRTYFRAVLEQAKRMKEQPIDDVYVFAEE